MKLRRELCLQQSQSTSIRPLTLVASPFCMTWSALWIKWLKKDSSDCETRKSSYKKIYKKHIQVSYIQSYIQIYSNCFSCFRLSCPSNFQVGIATAFLAGGAFGGSEAGLKAPAMAPSVAPSVSMATGWKTLEKRCKNHGKERENLVFFFLKGQKNRTLRLLKLPCVSLFSRANTEVQHLIIFVIGFLLCLVSPYAKKNRIPSRVARSVIGWRTISWS